MSSPGTFGSEHLILDGSSRTTPEQDRDAGLMLAELADGDREGLEVALQMLGLAPSPPSRQRLNSYGERADGGRKR